MYASFTSIQSVIKWTFSETAYFTLKSHSINIPITRLSNFPSKLIKLKYFLTCHRYLDFHCKICT